MEFRACSGSQGVSPISEAVTGMFEYQPIVSLPVEHMDKWITVCIPDTTLPNPTNMFFVLLPHNDFFSLLGGVESTRRTRRRKEAVSTQSKTRRPLSRRTTTWSRSCSEAQRSWRTGRQTSTLPRGTALSSGGPRTRSALSTRCVDGALCPFAEATLCIVQRSRL